MSLVAYRNLMRAARVAFQGDSHILSAAQVQIRDGFRQNASLKPSEPQTSEAIQHANEVATFLRSNVVQGRKMQDKDDTYELRIHKDTERGDNESIKYAGSGTAGAGCGCK